MAKATATAGGSSSEDEWEGRSESRLTLSGAPKILLYCTENNWPTTLAPTNEESSWAQ